MTDSSTPQSIRPTLADGRWRFLLISAVVLVLDQWTKHLVESHLQGRAAMEIIPDLLNFIYVRNTGVAFGLFASHGAKTGTLVLIALGLAALAFVLYYFSTVPRHERLLLVALALVLGGAVGNLADRIQSGGVTDFIDFYVGTYHWHTFNIADSAITVGIGLMIVATLRPQQEAPPESAAL